MSDVQRFDLPSGGWWELELDPTHGQVEDIRKEAIKVATAFTSNGNEPISEASLEAIINSGRSSMLLLTTAWSFPEPMPVTIASLRSRSGRDTAFVQDVLEEHISPLLEDSATRRRRRQSSYSPPSGSDGSLESLPTST